MSWENEDIDDWGTENYDNLFDQSSSDDFEESDDDLMDIDGMSEERAGKLIMTARAPWFA